MDLVQQSSPSDSVCHHTEEEMTVYVANDSIGTGTLYVSEGSVVWIRGSDSKGFALDYTDIMLHAISRDLSSFGFACIYMMVELGGSRSGGDTETSQDAVIFPRPAEGDEDMEDEGVSNDEQAESGGKQIFELRLVPSDPNSLDLMFQALSDCQALHPDPNQSCSDGSDGAEYDDYFGPVHSTAAVVMNGSGDGVDEGLPEMTPQGQVQLDRLNAMLAAQMGEGGEDERRNDMEYEDAMDDAT